MNTEINFDKTKDELLVESWSLSEDTRHGKEGYRVSRYLPCEDEKNSASKWDETYMFFETIDEAYKAFLSGDLKKGQLDF